MLSFHILDDISALMGHQLREAVKEEVNATTKRPITLGLLLWRVKKEKHFLKWGYPKIGQYYTKELHITISKGEIHVALARRCLSHEMSYAEMQTVERLVHHTTRLCLLTKYARNSRELLAATRTRAAGLPFQELKRRLGGYQFKPVYAVDIGEKSLDYEAVHVVNDWLKKKLKKPGHSLLIPFLVVKALHESKPGKRRRYLQRLFLRHNIPEGLVPEIFQEEE